MIMRARAWTIIWTLMLGGWAAGQTSPVDPALKEPAFIVLQNSPRLSAGKAVVERLGSILTDGAGPYAAARAGDWRLSNDLVSFTFAGVEGDPKKIISQPLAGFREEIKTDDRIPGALIDVTTPGNSLDALGLFTQELGQKTNAPLVEYDSIEPLQENGRVGLRMTGSPYENSRLRLETTYWLGETSQNLVVQSRLIGLAPGEEMPVIGDYAIWRGGTMLVEGHGPLYAGRSANTTTTLVMCRSGRISMGLSSPKGKLMRGNFTSVPPALRVAYPERPDAPSSSTTKVVYASEFTRDLWVAEGNFGAVTERVQKAQGVATGLTTGKLIRDRTKEPARDTIVQIYRIDMKAAKESSNRPVIYTMTTSDQEGRYKIDLPAGDYIIRSEPKTFTTGVRNMMSQHVTAGTTNEFDLPAFEESGVRVSVVDSRTSQPLNARIQFTPVPPTMPFDLGFPYEAAGYLNNAYIPAGGRTVPLPPGKYDITASHGFHYELAKARVTITNGEVAECTLALEESNPTPGWEGVEVGVRTTATPGCMVQARDIVLMAAAEGLNWIISGDFEKVTDLTPQIREAGLEDQLGFSRGFRTILPAHPEWGQFLIFPLAPDAPDPAKVREQWAGLKEAREFIAVLRKLYPGALIQSELPYTLDGQGYYGKPGQNIYQMSYSSRNDIELGIDSLNLFPARGTWDLKQAVDFWCCHLVNNRFYLATPSATGRVVLGAEPGYPRLLALANRDAEGKLSEASLFEAIRKHHIQVSSGPFVDFQIAGTLPGEVISAKGDEQWRMRVTAPSWIRLNTFTLEKDGYNPIMQQMGFVNENKPPIQRYPSADSGEQYHEATIREFRLAKDKDTLIVAKASGMEPIDMGIPTLFTSEKVLPAAVVFPTIVDLNGNGKHDLLPSFGDMGR